MRERDILLRLQHFIERRIEAIDHEPHQLANRVNKENMLNELEWSINHLKKTD